jgi:hypothetical protein
MSNTTNGIEPSLFTNLENITSEVKDVLMTTEKLEEMEKKKADDYLNKLGVVKEGLLLFMREFNKQFFHFGCGFDFQSLDRETIKQMDEKFLETGARVPNEMILAATDFVMNVSDNLVMVGYGGGDRFDLRGAYCGSLARLLQAFTSDGKDVIANYEEIARLSSTYMEKISTICQETA